MTMDRRGFFGSVIALGVGGSAFGCFIDDPMVEFKILYKTGNHPRVWMGRRLKRSPVVSWEDRQPYQAPMVVVDGCGKVWDRPLWVNVLTGEAKVRTQRGDVQIILPLPISLEERVG